MEGREAILKVHAKGKPFVPDVDLHMIAVRTPGFTGADLANVFNEAALLCARAGAQLIDNRAIDEAIDRVQAGRRSVVPRAWLWKSCATPHITRVAMRWSRPP